MKHRHKHLFLWSNLGKALLLLVYAFLFLLFLFGPCKNDGEVDYSSVFVSDAVCLVTALGLEVSFVTYIEESTQNRSFRRQMWKNLTMNTVFDTLIFLLLSISTGILFAYASYSFSLFLLTIIATPFFTAVLFVLMYFLSGNIDPCKQAHEHIVTFCQLAKSSKEIEMMNSISEVRDIFEECFSAEEFHRCERIAFDIYGATTKCLVDVSLTDSKCREDLLELYSLPLFRDFPSAGFGTLIRILRNLRAKAAYFLKKNRKDEADQITLFLSFYLAKHEDDPSAFQMMFSFFFDDYKKDKVDQDSLSPFIDNIILDVVEQLSVGQRLPDTKSEVVLIRFLTHALSVSNSEEKTRIIKIVSKLAFRSPERPSLEEATYWLHSGFITLAEDKDKTFLNSYISMVFLSDRLPKKCYHDVVFSDFILSDFNQLFGDGFYTKDLFYAYSKVIKAVVWNPQNISSEDVVFSPLSLQRLLSDKSLTLDSLYSYFREIFDLFVFCKKNAYAEAVLDLADELLLASNQPYSEDNPRIQFYFDLLKKLNDDDLIYTKTILRHLNGDIRKKDASSGVSSGQAKPLSVDDFIFVANLLDSFVVNNSLTDPQSSVIGLDIVRGFVEKESALALCMNNTKAAEKVFDCLFSGGSHAIESGNLNLLETASGALGWSVVWETDDRKRPSMAGYVLKKGTALFDMAFNVLGDCQGSVFVGTLIIICGAFTLQRKMPPLQNTIINGLLECHTSPESVLLKSKDLRSKEDVWDEVLGVSSGRVFSDFWDIINEKVFVKFK
jgi:hypothetical protein